MRVAASREAQTARDEAQAEAERLQRALVQAGDNADVAAREANEALKRENDQLRSQSQLSTQDRADLEQFRNRNPDLVSENERLHQQLTELQKNVQEAQGRAIADGREPNQENRLEAQEEQNDEKKRERADKQVEVHEDVREANVMRRENRVETIDSEDSNQPNRGFSADKKGFWDKKLSSFTPDWLTRKRAAGAVGTGLLAWMIGTDKSRNEKEIQYKSNNIASELSNTQMAVGATAALATAALCGKNFCADKNNESEDSGDLFGGILTRSVIFEESDDSELWTYFLAFVIFALVLLLSMLLCKYCNPKPVIVVEPDLDPPDLEMANAERICELRDVVSRKHSIKPQKAGSRALQISRNLKQYKQQRLSGMQLRREINSRNVSVLSNPQPNMLVFPGDGSNEIIHV